MVADKDGLTVYEEAPTTQKKAFGSSKESSFAACQGKHLGIEEYLITTFVYPKISAENIRKRRAGPATGSIDQEEIFSNRLYRTRHYQEGR
jgi:hypothetical protein